MKTTLIAHIYNEEYLLPFWLINHKDMFDNIIIIDYNSTDRSLEICKKICPNCKVIPSRNEYFDAQELDKEVMEIERAVDGIKIVLNVTEFLICENDIKDYFKENITTPIAFEVKSKAVFSPDKYNIFPKNNYELFDNIFKEDIFLSYTARSSRFIHNYPDGNYGTGRHFLNYKGVDRASNLLPTEKIQILYMGYYPLNKYMIKRRTQIGQKQSQFDIKNKLGHHHLWKKKEILNFIQNGLLHDKHLLNKTPCISNLIKTKLIKLKNTSNPILYNELLIDYDWGADLVILDQDKNLLKNTDFDDIGYNVLDIENVSNLLNVFIHNEIFFLLNKDINIENYHNELTEEEHKQFITKMPFKKDIYPDINKMCIYLEEYISEILSEPVKIFNNDIWVRVCRPDKYNELSDCTPCHRDVYLDFYRNLVNIYVPICGSNENSSLKMVPGSHKWNENKTMVTKGGAYFKTIDKKYSVDAVIASKEPLPFVRPNPNENQIILFSPYLIHGCSENNNKNITHFSLEVRFIKDDEESKKQEYAFSEFLQKQLGDNII
jgi:hypothetical protein